MDSYSQASLYGKSDVSYYLAMRDGTRLAISVYFPEHTVPRSPVPTILVLTRYGRATVSREGDPRSIDPWLRAGYACVAIDVRGTTSSFGARVTELGPDEQRDAEEIIAHVTAQAWSDGKVVATGVSYTGNTADMATARDAPGLIASIPRATDFDFWEALWTGGCPNDSMFEDWAKGVYGIDFGRPHIVDGAIIYPWQHNGLDGCKNAKDCLSLFPTLQPVDDDLDCLMLQEALRTREENGRHWTFEDYENALFRDDAGLNGHAIFDACTGAHVTDVVMQKKPVQFWASWMDSNTADEAINRFRSTPGVPTEIFLTAHDHRGGVRVDPLMAENNDPLPSVEGQHAEQLRFAEEVRQIDNPEDYSVRIIHYYVLGTGTYKSTPQWPPEGVENTAFLLSQGGSLVYAAPQAGIDTLKVDRQASAGKKNRWYQLATVEYGDRAIRDTKLLTYDTAPLEKDMELVGWPVITLHMRTRTNDPTIFVYLEDVTPDGRVSYLTEGVLRALHRKLAAAPEKLPYDPGPSPHSFARTDALPVVPEQDFTVKVKLFATAALIRKGHRIRLAISGADADTFRSFHRGLDERFDIHCGGTNPSVFEVPLRVWQL
ncbi:hypothetical protein LTR84_000744 [Exophiala bonariae]|uniref:Xaa-Pro dipeptidyl-peptidase C-terminal domain-containing protein n=1 Tax=Exophiala bonariae TaxID=1690606 RepID=A0AAV9NTZ6_9EURO|nr:hypothetical protein LTR84_000744 [Exophiala bonariae]